MHPVRPVMQTCGPAHQGDCCQKTQITVQTDTCQPQAAQAAEKHAAISSPLAFGEGWGKVLEAYICVPDLCLFPRRQVSSRITIDNLHSPLLASLHKPLRLNVATLHDLPSPNPRCCSSAIMPLAQPCSLLQPLYCITRAHPGPQCMSGRLVRRQFTIQLEGTASA